MLDRAESDEHSEDADDEGEEDAPCAPWYQPTMARELALELLSCEEEGGFVVRDSASHPGCYALSVRVPMEGSMVAGPAGQAQVSSRIVHYLIQRVSHGVRLKVSVLVFLLPSLKSQHTRLCVQKAFSSTYI